MIFCVREQLIEQQPFFVSQDTNQAISAWKSRMYDEDQDVDDLDRLLVCPYDTSHQVTASRMNHHLVRCRKNYYVTEKTICPFNAEHVIFEQEIETHKILCPERPDNVADEVKNSDEKEREDNENVDCVETEETKAHTNCDSDPQTDKESAETGCINGLKVGGLKDYNIDSTNGDVKETAMALHGKESTVNGETETPQENGANEKKCDLEDVSVSAVSHMAGFEPQDDNIAIEKQLSQSKANLSTSVENGDVNETTVNGHVEEQFDYKKYAPTKEERDEFLKLIKEHKEEQNGVDDKDESLNQNYMWQGYTYVTQPYHPNQSFPGMYNPGTTFIAYPNGTYHPLSNGQAPYPTHYTFQPGSGPVPQYIPPPVQGYDFNHGYTPRQHYRRPYRGRSSYHNNHSYNRHHNGYHKNNHYNGHNYNNGHSYNNGHRNHYNHYNGYYSHDAYSHTDTDSNSSASGHSDAGSADHSTFNGNGHHSDSERPHHKPRRTNHSSKGSVNLERIIHVNTDSEGESGPPSVNGHMLDLSPEPSESYECLSKRKGEKDKVIRKLRKKLNEIYALENKKNSGVQMDCDQLKKLTRKKELEEELAALTID